MKLAIMFAMACTLNACAPSLYGNPAAFNTLPQNFNQPMVNAAPQAMAMNNGQQFNSTPAMMGGPMGPSIINQRGNVCTPNDVNNVADRPDCAIAIMRMSNPSYNGMGNNMNMANNTTAQVIDLETRQVVGGNGVANAASSNAQTERINRIGRIVLRHEDILQGRRRRHR